MNKKGRKKMKERENKERRETASDNETREKLNTWLSYTRQEDPAGSSSQAGETDSKMYCSRQETMKGNTNQAKGKGMGGGSPSHTCQ